MLLCKNETLYMILVICKINRCVLVRELETFHKWCNINVYGCLMLYRCINDVNSLDLCVESMIWDLKSR